MKKFLEELKKAQTLYDEMPSNTDAERKYKSLRNKYKELIGTRALYTCYKPDKDVRVVTIIDVTDNCVILQYNYYGMDYHGSQITSVNYGALICGDAQLELEK